MTKSKSSTIRASSTAPILEQQQAFRAFRKRYVHMLRAAKREMTTAMQKSLIDTIAATAFAAGYNAPRVKAKPVTLRGWKAGVDRRL